MPVTRCEHEHGFYIRALARICMRGGNKILQFFPRAKPFAATHRVLRGARVTSASRTRRQVQKISVGEIVKKGETLWRS